jgi:peptide/nickel transport system permease protein
MYQAVRAELGLDDPVPVQYLKWLGRAVQGDFGRSIRTREPAVEGLLARLPVTVELSMLAMAVAFMIAVPIGILSAVRPNSKLDLAGTVVGMSASPYRLLAGDPADLCDGGVAACAAIVGLRALQQGCCPTSSRWCCRHWRWAWPGGGLMRQLRSALIEVLQHEYVLVARAKGLRPSTVRDGTP